MTRKLINKIPVYLVIPVNFFLSVLCELCG
jgi:hypothetical protein